MKNRKAFIIGISSTYLKKNEIDFLKTKKPWGVILFSRNIINFDQTKINSDKVFEELSNKRLILREMKQYQIPNALRLTIGNEKANEHFIQSIREILK